MHTDQMSDHYTALNAHVNILLQSKRMNPDYYSGCAWMVRYKDFMYDVKMENISALFVIDYMRKNALETFLGFTLHKHEDGEHYWLTVKI